MNMNTEIEYKTESGKEGEATYCPEDNKLRLYVGRIEREYFLELKEGGWKSTPNQGSDFVASWSVKREKQCFEYADEIADEDQSPEDRAADRAERFSGYRDKRLGEAVTQADLFDSGPSAHGYQDAKKAERSAARHDRLGSRAVTQWDKAEYWQSRTAGVISNALYKSRPDVRMGRIMTIEKDMRRVESYYTPSKDGEKILQSSAADRSKQVPFVWCGMGRGGYWVEESTLEGLEASYARFVAHCKLRIAYESQMLEAAGGRLASVEIQVGGRLGSKLIVKVSKSSVTKRVTSVCVLGPKVEGWSYQVKNIPGTDFAEYTFKTERMATGSYHAPDEESLNELAEFKKVLKAVRSSKPAAPKLINPTDEDAQRLQDVWTARVIAKREASETHYYKPFEAEKVLRLTQAQYSANSKGAYARIGVENLYGEGKRWMTDRKSRSGYSSRDDGGLGEELCKVRMTGRYDENQVIVITDKPQKALPVSVWEVAKVAEAVTA